MAHSPLSEKMVVVATRTVQGDNVQALDEHTDETFSLTDLPDDVIAQGPVIPLVDLSPVASGS